MLVGSGGFWLREGEWKETSRFVQEREVQAESAGRDQEQKASFTTVHLLISSPCKSAIMPTKNYTYSDSYLNNHS
jgi:hypothetical protein